MTWQAPARPPEAQALHDAAEADQTTRPERYRLDVDTIVERATGGGFDTSRFADGWRDGLEQYLGSAESDGRLGAFGRRMVADTAVGRLVAGVKVADRHAALDPPAPGASLAPPIVIIGGWRTGTTFLFRLLGSDPRLHAPLPGELSAPWRFAGLSPEDRERLADKAAGAHELLHRLNPTMAAVHLSGPRLPEECVLAMGTDLRNWGFTSTVRLDGYAAWLAEQDLGGSYRRYRQAVELFTAGDPRRLVLKAPAHTAELPHLAAAFPGAVVVQLHRDIVETIASGSSLFAVFRSTYSDHVDGPDVGRYQTEQTERWLRRAAAFRATAAASSVRFVDVDYERLVRDPSAVLRDIYGAAALAAPVDLAAFVDAYDRANPRLAHGPHRYTPDDFGLDPAELRARFSFLDAAG